MVSALDSGASGPGSCPVRRHCVAPKTVEGSIEIKFTLSTFSFKAGFRSRINGLTC